jgi:hypothetical protein
MENKVVRYVREVAKYTNRYTPEITFYYAILLYMVILWYHRCQISTFSAPL